MPKPSGTHFVVTGNLTDDGSPAYLDRQRGWTRDLAQAWPIEDAAAAEAELALATEQERVVCDPYLFMVTVGPTGIDPLSARETIRSKGPTTPVRRPD